MAPILSPLLAYINEKKFREALPLCQEYMHLSAETLKDTTVEAVLLNLYYAGYIHAVLKMYDKAMLYFQQAMCIPASAPSAICVEAQKKYILCSLIAHGTVLPHPALVPKCLSRALPTHCSLYNDFASHFTSTINSTASNDTTAYNRLTAFVDNHRQAFEKEMNYGLMRLTGMDSKSSLFKLLTQLIESGRLNATIDQQNETITFVNVEKTRELELKLQKLMVKTQTIVESLQSADLRVQESEQFKSLANIKLGSGTVGKEDDIEMMQDEDD